MAETRNILFFISIGLPLIVIGLSAWQLVDPSVIRYQKWTCVNTELDYCTYDRGNLVTCIYETKRNIEACEKYLTKRIGNTLCTYIASDQDHEPFSAKCLPCEVTSILSAGIALLSFILGFIWLYIHFEKDPRVAQLGQAGTNIVAMLIIIALQAYLSVVWKTEYENPEQVPKNVHLNLKKRPAFYSTYCLIGSAALLFIWNIVLTVLNVSEES
ncbi:hypothetical protein AAHC03_013708 [Spirometra sp. Aus1]